MMGRKPSSSPANFTTILLRTLPLPNPITLLLPSLSTLPLPNPLNTGAALEHESSPLPRLAPTPLISRFLFLSLRPIDRSRPSSYLLRYPPSLLEKEHSSRLLFYLDGCHRAFV